MGCRDITLTKLHSQTFNGQCRYCTIKIINEGGDVSLTKCVKIFNEGIVQFKKKKKKNGDGFEQTTLSDFLNRNKNGKRKNNGEGCRDGTVTKNVKI